MNGNITIASIILVLIPIILVGIELSINKWIRIVTNTYWFWLSIGLFCLFWYIFIAWRHFWSDLSMINIPWGTPLSFADSKIVSQALLLDICQFLNFALCITLIGDPTRKAAKAVAPAAVLGSILSLFFEILESKDAQLTWNYIFIGSVNCTDLKYFGFVMNLLIGMGIILNTPKFGWKSTVATYGFNLGFYTYAAIAAYSTGAQYCVSGVNLNDFLKDGTYNYFYNLFPNQPFISAIIFFFSIAIGLIGICILIDLCKRNYFAFGDKYSGIWWKYYDYNETTVKEPWGWFSRNWQKKHYKTSSKNK